MPEPSLAPRRPSRSAPDRRQGLRGTRGRRRIYLLRHGAVDYLQADGTRVADTDVALTAEGAAQCAMLASVLAGLAFDRCIHSGLARTRQSAELILAAQRIAPPELEERPAFREIEPGNIDDVPPERLDAEFTYGFEAAAQAGARFAGGEAYAGFYARVTGALAALLAEPDWGRMLLVAHGGTNRALLSWATHGGLRAFATFEQDEGCLNVLDIDLIDGAIARRYLRVVNYTPYNVAKDGLHLTTLERIVRMRARRRR